MNGNLRPAVASGEAARFAPDALAAFGVIRQFAAGHARAFNRGAQAQFLQLAHGVRQQVNADAEGFDLGHGLKDAHGEPGVVEAQSGRQPADSGADNNDLIVPWHGTTAKPAGKGSGTNRQGSRFHLRHRT